MGSEETQFKPGKSGNPKGMKVGTINRSTIAKKVLAMKCAVPEKLMAKLKELYPELSNKMTIEEIITIVQANKAMIQKDTRAYKALMDSAHGKPQESVDVTTDGEKITAINYIRPKDE